MKMSGHCYCGQIAYEFDAEPQVAMQCHCRECQYISGGFPNAAVAVPKDGFRFTQGEPKTFARTDIDNPRTRMFCDNCGTSLATLSPNFPESIILKVGTFDDPSVYQPTLAQFVKDAPPFHHVPEGLPAHQRTPKG